MHSGGLHVPAGTYVLPSMAEAEAARMPWGSPLHQIPEARPLDSVDMGAPGAGLEARRLGPTPFLVPQQQSGMVWVVPGPAVDLTSNDQVGWKGRDIVYSTAISWMWVHCYFFLCM